MSADDRAPDRDLVCPGLRPLELAVPVDLRIKVIIRFRQVAEDTYHFRALMNGQDGFQPTAPSGGSPSAQEAPTRPPLRRQRLFRTG